MNLYKINPTQHFLKTVADFIDDNFKNNIDRLKVILPNGVACLNLQKLLVEKRKVTILPNIIPFSDICAESEDIFKIPSENIGTLSYLEEKIILAEIIHDYGKLGFNLQQSLKISSQLARLFYEFSCNSISIESIKNLPTVNYAEHWELIYEFLIYAYQNWKQKIATLKKSDKAMYQINMLESEIMRIKNNPSNSLIVAGMIGQDLASWNFIKNVTAEKSGFLILPPIPEFADQLVKTQDSKENTLFALTQLLKLLNKNLSEFKTLGSSYDLKALDNLIISKDVPNIDKSSSLSKIEYEEFEDIFEEAQAISDICRKNPDKKVAIIINNEKNKPFYCNFLNKYDLEFHDLSGNDLSKTNIVQLIIALSELLCNEFKLTNLFILLKNPLIYSLEVRKLEQILGGKNRFVSNFEQILNLVEKDNDLELIEWCKDLKQSLETSIIDNHFNKILKKLIKVSEEICKNIWSKERAFEVSQFFAELIELDFRFFIKNRSDFPEVLKLLISCGKFFENNEQTSNIVICKPNDAILLKFDVIILADFSQGNWPRPIPISPWLNNQMQDELNLYSQTISSSESLYHFYLLMHNERTIVTRSKKQGGNAELLPSNYMLKLQLFSNTTKIKGITKSSDSLNNNKTPVSFVSAKFFPSTISATDIESLIRSPYSFYAKKILGLRKTESISENPKLSEFGSFIHNVIEIYSKNYDKNKANKVETILEISDNLLSNSILPKSIENIWKIKFKAIAEEFIEFDEERRRDNVLVYSEVRGEMKLNIAEQVVNIIAVADRIEVDTEGICTIMDYKTGGLPSKKDVMSGLSPQLIIEALIMLNGGFGIKVNEVKQLVYVKISSSKPYINITQIPLTKSELNAHMSGLQSLLEYYVKNKQFSLDLDISKYNDYKHLARTL